MYLKVVCGKKLIGKKLSYSALSERNSVWSEVRYQPIDTEHKPRTKKKKLKRKSSRYHGVGLFDDEWRAYISIKGKLKLLGKFAKEHDAAKCVNEFCAEHKIAIPNYDLGFSTPYKIVNGWKIIPHKDIPFKGDVITLERPLDFVTKYVEEHNYSGFTVWNNRCYVKNFNHEITDNELEEGPGVFYINLNKRLSPKQNMNLNKNNNFHQITPKPKEPQPVKKEI
eukprot:UN24776